MLEKPQTNRIRSLMRRFLLSLAALLIATCIWLPLVHLLFVPRAGAWRSENGIPPMARSLAQRHLSLWTSESMKAQVIDPMRVSNPEWDFMGRTFLVLSMANMILRDPSLKVEYLPIMDTIIRDTQQNIEEHDIYYFLMAYGQSGSFVQQPVRSLFIDGEIALMMGARRLIEESEELREPMQELINTIVDRMSASPAMVCESYPNECWLFCNTLALAAVRMQDALENSDNSPFFNDWLATVKERLTDRESGLLSSSCTWEGYTIDGPEGSSIWMIVHCLQIIDREFATDQYNRARSALRRSLFGFDWAREWAGRRPGFPDIDSGPIIPILDVSAGSSGMAFLGAASFGDEDYYNGLATTLNFAGFPSQDQSGLRFCASNQVGDAVLLYSMVVGPLWELIETKPSRSLPS